MSRKDFLAILDLRQDELDEKHRADLIETALKIMLYKPTWSERVYAFQREWSRIHNNQEIKRRAPKKPKVPDTSTRLIIEPGVYKE